MAFWGNVDNRKRGVEFSHKKGFTLVELIVVVVIVAILAAIAVPTFLAYIDKTNDKKAVAEASQAFTSTQGALTEIYNNAANRLDPSRRSKAKSDAQVENESKFVVWTFAKLEDGVTKGISDNISSYTIKNALFVTKDERYVFFNGKDWLVYNSASALNADADYASVKAENIIYMWGYEGVSDSAYKADLTYEYAGSYDWTEADEVVEVSKNITLCGFRDKNEYRVKFIDDAGNEKDSIEVNFARIGNDISNPFSHDSNGNLKIKDVNGDSYSILYTSAGLDFIGWGSSAITDEDKLYANEENLKNAILNGDTISDNSTFYINIRKAVTEKTVTFAAYNTNTFVLKDENGNLRPNGQVQVTFRKYANEYDTEFADNRTIAVEAGNKVRAADPSKNLLEGYYVDEDATLTGWALALGGGRYEYKNNSLALYDMESDEGVEAIWNKVFNESGSLFFVNVLERDIKATLKTDENSSFTDNSNSKMLEYKYVELTGETKVNTFANYYSDCALKLNAGYKFAYWLLQGTTTQCTTAEQIKNASAGNGNAIFLVELINQTSGTFLSNGTYTNNLNTFKGQINYMGNGNKNKVIGFKRENDLSELESLFDNFDELFIQTGEDAGKFNKDCKLRIGGKTISPTLSGNGACYQIDSSGIHRIVIMYDGYGANGGDPIIAYTLSKEKQGDAYVPIDKFKSTNASHFLEAHWYTESENPIFTGDRTEAFRELTNMNFEDCGIGTFDTYGCTNMSGMFLGCVNLKETDIDFTSLNYGSVTTTKKMFMGCTSLTKTPDFGNADFYSLTDATSMFENCTSMVTAEFETFKTPNATGMFKNCTALKTADLSNWDFSGNVNLNNMFENCSSLESVEFPSRVKFKNNNIQVTKMFIGSSITPEALGDIIKTWDISETTMFNSGVQIISKDMHQFDSQQIYYTYDGKKLKIGGDLSVTNNLKLILVND